jgi:hypothetical protein
VPIKIAAIFAIGRGKIRGENRCKRRLRPGRAEKVEKVKSTMKQAWQRERMGVTGEKKPGSERRERAAARNGGKPSDAGDSRAARYGRNFL